MVLILVFLNSLLWNGVYLDATVTIYNEWLSQGGRVHYEADRWTKHNGLDRANLIPYCKAVGSPTGRWMNRDLNDHLFGNWPQDPHHHGYPDPHYLENHALQSKMFSYYMEQVHGYGSEIKNIIWDLKGLSWPDWMDKSHHEGKFPNNLDAAGEFVSLMVQSAKDYSGGHIPHILEVINEPEVSNFIGLQSIIDFHKVVGQKLKSRFGMQVAGPTYTSYSIVKSDLHNFGMWNKTAVFLDMSLDHLDFFSFHAYNDLYVSGGKFRFTGINEARLVGGVDMIENYSHLKKGKKVPLVISEYGRGGVTGLDLNLHNSIIDFATTYLPSGFMFTFLNLREFLDRTVIFMLSNEQYGSQTSLNWSIFTKDGRETTMAKFFKFWHSFHYDQKFLKVSSPYTGWERSVSPLALADPHKKELVVLLHNYGTAWQNVKLDFHGGWINLTTGESTCIQYKNGNTEMHTNVHFDTTKYNGNLGLPGQATCFYKFKTNYNFDGLRTNNENTYYGKDMVIPINNGHAQTTISLPSSGYHTSHLRVGVSRDKNASGKPHIVVFNGYTLPSTFTLFDSDKVQSTTKWEVWEFWVPADKLKATNTITMNFDGNGGHVSSVALVVGKLE
ncbi:beta-porphyranase A-like [Haliotis rubra]|uniref:beta-porphyranase A-like n=1 Tax=Haliotis rubra TaxID=36100 RepID=UPI001EE50BA0|nr:beta-porphyranase A-like [Haliotis rubra]